MVGWWDLFDMEGGGFEAEESDVLASGFGPKPDPKYKLCGIFEELDFKTG